MKLIKLKMRKFIIKFLVYLLEVMVGKSDHDFEVSATLRQKQTIFLNNVSRLIRYAHVDLGYELTGGELLRTPEQQAIYYKNGLSKTLNSRHLQRLAIDLNVFIKGVYRTDKDAFKELSAYWKSLHPDNVSGYEWGWDYNHFEMKP